jgi:type IV secretion system protein VirD4
VYQITAFAFSLISAALIFDTFAGITEHHRGALKAAGWLCLPVGSVVAACLLKALLSGLCAVYQDLRDIGWPVHTAAYEALQSLRQYSDLQHTAILIACGISIACIALAVLMILSAILRPPLEQNRNSATGPWQADWMKPSDIAYLKSNKSGLPSGAHQGRLLRYSKNDPLGWRGGHHLVVAGTQGGKGVAAVIPTILDHVGPVVALDIKGENFAVTQRHRATLGRQVVVLNPFGLIEASTDQFNPLDYIRTKTLSRDIEVIADGLVKPEQGDGAHFSTMARQLVAAAIEVIFTQEEPQQCNLVAVSDLLLAGDLDVTLQAWVENADLVGRRPTQVAAKILRAGDRERGSIQTSVAKAFSWMQSDVM